MEQVKYVVEDEVLIALLGIQNFTNKESAILELIKNAFDAGALTVNIYVYKDKMIIDDDGCGMDVEDIKKQWMHIGKSSKGYDIVDNNGQERVLSGSKGVGRFALARLGGNVRIISKKDNKPLVVWKTNWNKTTIDTTKEEIKEKGTKIVITSLRDKWTKKTTEKLADYIGRTYCDDKMEVNLSFIDDKIKVKKYFIDPKIGENYSTKILLNYNANDKKLYYSFESDEFSKQAEEYSKTYNIYKFNDSISISEEFSSKTFDDEIDNMDNELQEVGNFKAEFYFGIERILAGDDMRFLYKRKSLPNMYSPGIILYRNSFSISSYDGKKDWLGLGKRSRKSPAAATHPTGSWRVRENQISGSVKIDKEVNRKLRDLSNRQGLDENISYQLFVEIILTGISEFERYRQTIIREINKKNKDNRMELKDVTIEKVIKNPFEISKLTEQEQSNLVTEIKELQKDDKDYKRDIRETERRYKYDVRILNVLATSGLRATSIAHEMRNDRNKLDVTYNYIVEALKAYNMWDILNSEENTRYADMNIPSMLYDNKEIGDKLMQFMDIMLEEIEKKQFLAKDYSISLLLNNLKEHWEKDYSWISINIVLEKEIKYNISEDIINVIFDNLLLNSVQQNAKNSKLDIIIAIKEAAGLLNIDYSDSGVGLKGNYMKNPMKILEPHETSRKNGHGLGMWIVNNTLNMSGGEVIDIPTGNGFEIIFTIGGKL